MPIQNRVSPKIERLAMICVQARNLKKLPTKQLEEIQENSDAVYELLNQSLSLALFGAGKEIKTRRLIQELTKISTKKLREMEKAFQEQAVDRMRRMGYDDTDGGDENEHEPSLRETLITQILDRRLRRR